MQQTGHSVTAFAAACGRVACFSHSRNAAGAESDGFVAPPARPRPLAFSRCTVTERQHAFPCRRKRTVGSVNCVQFRHLMGGTICLINLQITQRLNMTRALLLLLTLLALPLHAVAASLKNNSGGPPWLSGVGQIAMPGGYSKWKQVMGYDVDIMAVWVSVSSMNTWNDFETGQGGSGAYLLNAMNLLPKSTPIIVSYPMLPISHSNRGCKNPGVWDQFARGDFDNHYAVMAKNFKQLALEHGRDPSNHIFRLGWEMNGEHYPWSICNKVSEFKQSWERAVGIIRAELPGVLFDFSPAHRYVGYTAGRNYNGTDGINLAGFLPDPSTYDVISMSHHDVRPFTTSDSVWEEFVVSPPKSERKIGLKELVDTATANGKKFALTEWGTQITDCGPDHPAASNPALFLRKTYEFLYANRSKLAWDTHFSVSCTQVYDRLSTAAGQTYKDLWASGGDDGSSPNKVPTPPQQVSVD